MSITASDPTPLRTLTPEEPAAEAARSLAIRGVGSVPAEDSAGRLVGLVSERDIVRVVATRAMGLRGVAVGEVMTREPVTVLPETSLEAPIELMQQRALRHLPLCSPKACSLASSACTTSSCGTDTAGRRSIREGASFTLH